MSKSAEDYMKDLLHCQDLIDLNLTRLARLVTQIQKLRSRERYMARQLDLRSLQAARNRIGQMTSTSEKGCSKKSKQP